MSAESERVICPDCGDPFTARGLSLHRRYCDRDMPLLTCLHCGGKYSGRGALTAHENRCFPKNLLEGKAKASNGAGKAKAKTLDFEEVIGRKIDACMSLGYNVDVDANDVDLSVFS